MHPQCCNTSDLFLFPVSTILVILRLFFCAAFAAREQLGGNKYLLTDGLFVAKMLDRTLVEYPAKDARYVHRRHQRVLIKIEIHDVDRMAGEVEK